MMAEGRPDITLFLAAVDTHQDWTRAQWGHCQAVPVWDQRPRSLCFILAAAPWAVPGQHGRVKQREMGSQPKRPGEGDGSVPQASAQPGPVTGRGVATLSSPTRAAVHSEDTAIAGSWAPCLAGGGRGADAARRELSVRERARHALGGGQWPRVHPEVQRPWGTVGLTKRLEARAGQGATWGCSRSPLQSTLCSSAGCLLGCVHGVEWGAGARSRSQTGQPGVPAPGAARPCWALGEGCPQPLRPRGLGLLRLIGANERTGGLSGKVNRITNRQALGPSWGGLHPQPPPPAPLQIQMWQRGAMRGGRLLGGDQALPESWGMPWASVTRGGCSTGGRCQPSSRRTEAPDLSAQAPHSPPCSPPRPACSQPSMPGSQGWLPAQGRLWLSFTPAELGVGACLGLCAHQGAFRQPPHHDSLCPCPPLPRLCPQRN